MDNPSDNFLWTIERLKSARFTIISAIQGLPDTNVEERDNLKKAFDIVEKVQEQLKSKRYGSS